MTTKQIRFKGTGDFKDLIDSAKKVSGILQNTLGKGGVQLFDKGSVDFLKQHSKNLFSQMQQEMAKLTKEAKELDKVLKSSTSSERDQAKALKDRLTNLQKMSDLHKQMAAPSSSGGFLKSAAGVASGGLGSVARASGIGGTSVVGAAMGAASGGSGMASMLGLGALGAAFGALTLTISRVMSVFNQLETAIPNMFQGIAYGIGAEPGVTSRNRGVEAGYGISETMSQRLSLSRSFGTNNNSNILANSQMISRILGIDVSQIAGAGNQLRGVMGGEGANRAVSAILSKAMTDSLNNSQATHFLQSSVALLASINKSGMQNTAAFINAMGTLTGKGGLPPEAAARVLSGIQGAISGASGENAQFFRFAAARGGIGRGSMLGSVFAQQQGMAGINPTQFLKMTGGNRQALSMLGKMGLVDEGGYSQRYAQGILDQVSAAAPNPNSVEGFSTKTRFMQQMFGLQTPAETFQVENILKKMAVGGTSALTDEERKKFEGLGKEPTIRLQENMLEVMKSLPGEIAQKLAKQENISFELAKESKDLVLGIKDTLIGIDTSLTELVKGAKSIGGMFSNKPGGAFSGGILGRTADEYIAGPLGSLAGYGMLDSGATADPKLKKDMELLKDTSFTGLLSKMVDLLFEGNEDRKKITNPKTVNQPPYVPPRGKR